MSTLNAANAAALLSSGQNPVWTEELITSGIPNAINSGVSVSQSLRSQLEVSLRRKAHVRSAVLTPVIFSSITTYRTYINGNITEASGANLDAMLIALALAINANVAVNTTVTATAVDSTFTPNAGNNTLLLIEGLLASDWSFDVLAIGGGGTVSGSADGVSAVLNVYLKGGGASTPSGRWVKINNMSDKLIDSGGFVERFDVSGSDRISAHLVVSGLASDGASIAFDSQVMHGPSV